MRVGMQRIGLSLVILLSSCARAPHMAKSSRLAESSDGLRARLPGSKDSSPFPLKEAQTAFSKLVYKPLLRPYCASCHEPTFAAAQEENAFAAFLDRLDLDNFFGSDEEIFVSKLASRHNCWLDSNARCVEAMKNAVDSWLAELAALGYEPRPGVYPNATAAVDFKTAKAVSVSYDATRYAVASAESATIMEPFIKATDDGDGKNRSYIIARPGTAPNAFDTFDINNPSPLAKFPTQVPAAGKYSIWARLKSTGGGNMPFFMSKAPDFFATLTARVTPEWKWAKLMINDDEPMLLEASAPGPFSVDLGYADGGVKINQIVLSLRDEAFDADVFSTDHFEISVPLPFPKSRLIATIWNIKGQNQNAIGIRELRVESPQPLHIKGIYPLINGRFQKFNATYRDVDTVVGDPSDPKKQIIETGGARSSTWIADMSKDTLAFAFDLIEAVRP